MKSANRVTQIIGAALEIAHKSGLHSVTCKSVAKKLDMTHGNVLYHVGTADRLRDMTARRAIAERDRIVLANLITTMHPVAAEIPSELRREILSALT